MRNRVHPAGRQNGVKTFAPSPRDPEDGSNAFTDVQDAWAESPAQTPEKATARSKSGGGLVPMLAPIDSMRSDASLGVGVNPPPRSPDEKPRTLVGGDPMGSARSQDSASHLSTPRLSARKHHADEDKDDDNHRHPTCCAYYASRNRCVRL